MQSRKPLSMQKSKKQFSHYANQTHYLNNKQPGMRGGMKLT